MKHTGSSNPKPLTGKNILITGAARRIGRSLALSVAHAGGNVIIHHGHSPKLANQTLAEIKALGSEAHIISADLADPNQASDLYYRACAYGPLYAIVNNAAIFEPVNIYSTTTEDWQRHFNINLTAPFLLCQALAKETPQNVKARIVNILDWRALRPGVDHFPYTITKSALAAMTKSLAVSLAPNILVNGLALGAVLPPADQNEQPNLIKNVPAKRWATLEELGQTLLFLLAGPDYITGEILHIDGGRHLV